ncbi:MAG: hypothetical protein JO134_20260 [Xanthobacteraceae bacterium]|jgi:hypothetical protein|nr:hypothetical protein [Xanthobacteraceae bacterium]
MKRFGVFFAIVASALGAIALFGGSAPNYDTKQLGQIDIQTLMKNSHDLPDTTPAVPY